MNHTFAFLFLLFSAHLNAQNLIMNGDFEDYWECPDNLTQVERCKFVYNPCVLFAGNFISTSDYFNSCTSDFTTGITIPNVGLGFQYPKSGNGMVGFLAEDNFDEGSIYREYIQVSFYEPLVLGNSYFFEAYFNLANSFGRSLRGLGFYFSESELNNEPDYLFNNFVPQVIDNTTVIADTLSWTKISFEFIADRPYQFLSFGSLKAEDSSSYVSINLSVPNQGFSTYFYVDSVSLTLSKESQPLIPNVFTPNNDGFNDVFKPLIGGCAIKEMVILNRWGNKVANLKFPIEWDGKVTKEEEASEGVYFYIIYYLDSCNEEKQKQGMIHLIR